MQAAWRNAFESSDGAGGLASSLSGQGGGRRPWWGVLGAGLWLLFAVVYFVEYRPPLNWVFIPYDMDGYHLPLMDGALQSLQQGDLPLWDEAIYNGIPLLANGQAALWYPPTWVLLLLNLGKENLRYGGLKDFAVLHVGLACWFAFLWLRSTCRPVVAAVAGALVVGCSGYLMTQLQHLGLLCGFAWFPLGMWGVEESRRLSAWRPLWKTTLASTMVMLAGYTPFWPVFVACVFAFGLAGPKQLLRYAAALGLSVGVATVQLLPMLEASTWMVKDSRFGTGVESWDFFASMLLPNYFAFGMQEDVMKNFGRDYWYLGGLGLLGLALAVRFARPLAGLWGRMGLLLGLVLFLLLDPKAGLSELVARFPLLDMVLRSWYFLAAVPLVVGRLTAAGLAASLEQGPTAEVPSVPSLARRLLWPVQALAVGWAGYLLFLWWPGGADFATGMAGLVYPCVSISLLFLLLQLWQFSRKSQLLVLLLVVAATEFKALGTSRRFNAGAGRQPEVFYTRRGVAGLDPNHVTLLQANRQFRIAVDDTGPSPQHFRQMRLTTPGGFDPLYPAHIREYALAHGKPTSDRTFALDPFDFPALRQFGVGFVLVSEASPDFSRMLARPDLFTHEAPHTSYFKLFRVRDSEPAFRWSGAKGEPMARQPAPSQWRPATKEFVVNLDAPAVLTLKTNSYPGWQFQVDGFFRPLQPCGKFAVCGQVPAGSHTVRFRYLPNSLLTGGAISVLALGITLVAFLGLGRTKRAGERAG